MRDIRKPLPNRLVFSLLILSAVGLVYRANAQTLLPIQLNGQFGYINTDGRLVIEPQFDFGGDFANGLAPVGKKTGRDFRYGYIDEKGMVTIPIQFQDAREFSEGFAVVRFRDRYGFIDRNGKFIADPVFDKAFSFSDGLARIVQVIPNTGESLYGFVDRLGKLVIKPQYVFALDFREGLAGFAVAGNKTLNRGFIDKRNRVVIKPNFNIVGPFSEGLAVVAKHATTYLFEGQIYIDEESSSGKKIVYVDKRGSVVISGNFDTAASFSEGLAKVEIDGRCHYIDRVGNVLLRPEVPTKAVCGNFSQGMASVNADNGAKFVDKNGKIVVSTNFDWAGDFHRGAAKVGVVRANGLITYGYIDYSGRIIMRP